MKTLESLIRDLNESLPMSDENRRRLDQKVRLEFNFNSNHLEGNTLTYGETELLLLFDKTTGNHNLREYEEMKSHDVAFEMIKQWASDPELPLNEAGIRELHRILMVRPFWKEALTPDGQPTRREIKIGAYKSYPNSVRLQNGDIFHYASPDETPMLMGQLLDWYREEEARKELDPVRLASHFHYKFVTIHPFDDGNGRMARLLMCYILLKHQLPPVIIKSADKKNYLFALNQADTGNIEAFAAYTLRQMLWSLELYVKAAKGENIEEFEDLDKEIAVWRKGLKLNQQEVLRSTAHVKTLFLTGGLKDLFVAFEQQLQQFRDLFYDSSIKYAINGHASIYEFNELIESVKTEMLEDGIVNLEVKAALREFKLMPNPSIKFLPFLSINFLRNQYEIFGERDQILTKKYAEPFTELDRDFVLRAIIRQLFIEIKTAAKIP